MKKVWEVIRKILIWIGTVFVAIFTVVFVKEHRDSMVVSTGSNTGHDEEEINARAEKKRQETIERISNVDARSICESYGSVCDAIADGKERFRKRCQRTDD